MKRIIAVIHSNPRRGNTWNCVEQFKKSLSKYEQFAFAEHTVSTELPALCTGCHSCILHGVETCPHYRELAPILEDIFQADGVIFDSPVSVLDVNGSMKNFLDHLGSLWVVHCPRQANYFAIGMAITTAGACGMKRAKKTMLQSFRYMGFRRSYSVGVLAQHVCTEKAKKRLDRAAKKFYRALDTKDNLSISPLQWGMFNLMRKSVSAYDDETVAKRYWKEKGWLGKERPWKD